MAFLKKRTTKMVGIEVSKSIARQHEKERNLRALQKENQEKAKEIDLNRRIAAEKRKRPSFVKSFVKVTAQSVKTAKKVVAAKNQQSNVKARKRRATGPKAKRLTLTGDSGIF